MSIYFHKFRTFIITTLAVLIILTAVVFSIIRVALPHITDYGDDIETELSSLLGLTVEIGFVDADMYWLTPRLKLLDVSIYDASGERHFLHFNEIHLSLAWLKTITTLRPALGFVSLSGLDLHIERKNNGDLVVQGFDIKTNQQGRAQLPPGIELFLENFSFYLFDSSLSWSDEMNNQQLLDVQNINLAMINHVDQHEMSIDMELPPAYGEHVQLKAVIDGPLLQPKLWQAKLYLALENFRLRRWFDDYWRLFDFVASGDLDANVWLALDQGKLTQVDSVINGKNLALHYLDDDVRSWKLQSLMGMGNWKYLDTGWKAEIRALEMTRNNRAWIEPGSVTLMMDSLHHEVTAKASYLRIEDLVYLTGLTNNLFPDQSNALLSDALQYEPRGDLIHLDMHLPLDHPENINIQTDFRDIGYSTSNRIPAVTGLDGELHYHDSEALIQLDSRDVEFDFHGMFRNRIDLQSVYGKVAVYRENNAWHLYSQPIDAISPYIRTLSSVEVIVADGQAPFMNLITLFDKGDGAHKSLYFPTAVMDKKTVDWLDEAIVKADIPRGGFLYHGTFKDYPFNHGEGVMEVLFDIENSTLKYMPDWPALENLKAEVRFLNKSMSISKGEGTIYGARFYETSADINQLDHAHLAIKGRVNSPLADLLKFVETSPLHKKLGSYLTSIQAQGQSDLDIDIQIPIASHDAATVTGDLTFHDNEVFLPHENYRFEAFSGNLAFTEHSINSRNLQSRLGGSPVQLTIATEGNAGEDILRITGQGNVPVKTLLTPVPKLVEYMDGSADVDVDIEVLLHAETPQKHLGIAVQASMDKATSNLPAPFAKNSDESANLDLAIDVFADDRLAIELAFADKASLEARVENSRWQVSLDSAEIKGTGFFDADFSVDEPVRLDIDYVNVTALVPQDEGLVKQKIKPQQIPPLDINIHMLDWKQWQFSDVSLQTQRTKKGMQVDHLELHGPSISVVGKGSWLTGWRNTNISSFDFLLRTTDFGEALKTMDITQSIRKTEGEVGVKWQWNAEPYNFNWDLVSGEANIKFEDGSLSEIEPGAGRLLGIFNFETLLSLDFGSQVSKGFAFDSMKGKLNFNAGNAYTNDFTIKGKVADIGMQGRIGLSAEDYDQVITVTPGVGSTLTLIGAVAGGPVTAAVVHFVQKVFGINRMAAYKYSVKGPWEKPEVKLLVKPEKE